MPFMAVYRVRPLSQLSSDLTGTPFFLSVDNDDDDESTAKFAVDSTSCPLRLLNLLRDFAIDLTA
jgi:hypothetical protein